MDPSRDIVNIFKTLHMVKKKLIKGFRAEGIPNTLTHSSGRVLHIIITHSGLTMSELHDLTGLERGSLTSIVDGFIDQGYVQRKRGEEDRRKVFVAPTPEGITAARKVHEAADRYIVERLDKLSEQDRQDFLRAVETLDKIINKL